MGCQLQLETLLALHTAVDAQSVPASAQAQWLHRMLPFLQAPTLSELLGSQLDLPAADAVKTQKVVLTAHVLLLRRSAQSCFLASEDEQPPLT